MAQRFYYTAEQAAEVRRRNKHTMRILTGIFFACGLMLGSAVTLTVVNLLSRW